jgi:hypothetical protein
MQEYMNALPAKAHSPFCLDKLDEPLAAQPTGPEIINNITTKIFTTSVYLREGVLLLSLGWVIGVEMFTQLKTQRGGADRAG